MIETRLLRNALALARHRNFARAATALNISQPTLSRSIQALETRLGARLFDRKARTVLPTAVGEELLKHARLVVASSLALEEGIQQFRGMKTGSLAVGIGPYAASTLLGQALSRFNREYPDIRISAMVDDWVNLPRRLKERDFDFVLMEITQLETDPALEIRPLLPHQGFLFCSGTHPVLQAQTPTLPDLVRYPFVLPTLPQRVLKLFNSLFSTAGADVIEQLSTIHSNDVSLIRSTVATSEAIGIATYGMIAEELESGRLVALPFYIPELKTAYGIVSRSGLSLPPAATAFSETLVAINTSQCALDARFAASLV